MRVCDGRWQLIEGAEDRSEDVLRREKTDKSGLSKSATNREDRGGGEFHRYLSIRYLSPPLGLPFFSASSYLLIGYSKISETRRDRREARRDGEKEEEAQEEEEKEEEEEFSIYYSMPPFVSLSTLPANFLSLPPKSMTRGRFQWLIWGNNSSLQLEEFHVLATTFTVMIHLNSLH